MFANITNNNQHQINTLLGKITKLKEIYNIFKNYSTVYAKELNDIITLIMINQQITQQTNAKLDSTLYKYMKNVQKAFQTIDFYETNTPYNTPTSDEFVFNYEIRCKIQQNRYVFHKYIVCVDNCKVLMDSRQFILNQRNFIFLNSKDIVIMKSDPYGGDSIVDKTSYICHIRHEIDKITEICDILDANLKRIASSIFSINQNIFQL